MIKTSSRTIVVSFQESKGIENAEEFYGNLDDTGLDKIGMHDIVTGMHNMVLIGARKSSVGECFFLIQNWWEVKYFIEVSGDYMHRCLAIITFVKKDITRKQVMSEYVCDALYSETSADASETFFERGIV